jgi:hypothetical protein
MLGFGCDATEPLDWSAGCDLLFCSPACRLRVLHDVVRASLPGRCKIHRWVVVAADVATSEMQDPVPVACGLRGDSRVAHPYWR